MRGLRHWSCWHGVVLGGMNGEGGRWSSELMVNARSPTTNRSGCIGDDGGERLGRGAARGRGGGATDAGYTGVGKHPENRDPDVDWRVAMEPAKRWLLDRDGAEAAAEKRKASVRAKAEHPFLYLKGA